MIIIIQSTSRYNAVTECERKQSIRCGIMACQKKHSIKPKELNVKRIVTFKRKREPRRQSSFYLNKQINS